VTAAALLSILLAGELAAPPVRVASKKFTESVLLGELAAQLARDAGAAVEQRSELGGTRVLWEALRRGDVDVYPEYTGTLLREILAGERIQDGAGLAGALAAREVALSAPLGFEDTYAIGMRRERAQALGIRTISDLARQADLRLAFTHEFLDRSDGWPALRAAYRLPQRRVRGLDHDLAYRALAAGEVDAIDLYSTDAEIRQYAIQVLEDDRRAFPEYQAVLVYRADLAQRAPAALAAIRRLEGQISVADMIALNVRARLDGVPAPEVAADFLRQRLGVDAETRRDGLARRLLRRTGEHLALVGIALAVAIALAIPLGIWAARHPRGGSLVLGAVGVIQTIPSLALLVLMLPLLGIGARPAIAALVLYGLLPIVRNTHAGLVGIAPDLRESAEALGLPPAARLRLIELPLAGRAILAGVKTSAVIGVGTATLGALIGAGGYGQPILAGIRLASTPLILEGAVPAALLALGVDALFSLVERRIVSRGLRC
jgi:osmoprotectant transport system permease protein